MRGRYGVLLLGLLLAQLAVAGEPGRLEIYLTDHRQAIDDFASLVVELEALRVKRRVGWRFWQSGWEELVPQQRRLDLTAYTDGRRALVFAGAVAAGTFDALELRLAGLKGVLRRGGKPVAVTDRTGPLAVTFRVRPQQTTRLVLDLVVLDLSDHGQGYVLQVAGYAQYENGVLVDKVPPG
ncbi:MAG: hypothetical protein KatS3mg131_3920 [Candidatus Tectimicrobiota bacterium]|nr:MAG: hypothetical protein KatS3mg131_3920 [Candidatus Tectomicrobia bacterium]